MIQRIQTLYLLLVGILMTVVLFFPLLLFQTTEVYYEMDAVQLKEIGNDQFSFSTFGLFIIGAASALIALVTIFLYKKRIIQIRLTIFNTLLIIGFILFVFYLGYNLGKQLNAEWHPTLILSFPVICLILNYLAIRGIGADEALIRSLNRLR